MPSKYDALGHFLMAASPLNSVTLTFQQVQQLIGADIPESAQMHHQPWWANDKSHVQAKAWLNAGWKRASVDMADRTVTFVKASTQE